MPDHPSVLLFGRTGQLGRALMLALAPSYQITSLGHAECDLSSPGSATQIIADVKPDLVINAAAYTAVDQAEADPDLAYAVNRDAVAEMAQICATLGIPLVHYSTDYVFDGSARTPYKEDDPVAPLGVYGASKQAGDAAIQAAGGPHLILRTSWVYAMEGRNFLVTIQRLADEQSVLRIVSDQIGAPTWAGAIATATASVLEKSADLGWNKASGLYHMSAGGQTSWHGFAEAILAQMAACDPAFVAPPVEAITTADYPTPARRPAYSVLSNAKLEGTFGVRLPSWEEQLKQAFLR